MSIYGTFYALARKTFSPHLAWINFACAALGVVIMIPSLAIMLSTGNAALEPAAGISSLIALLVFAVPAFRELKRPHP